jgi:hypothetical protein
MTEAISGENALVVKDLRQAIILFLVTFATGFSSLMLVWALYWQKDFGLACIEAIRSAIVLIAMLFIVFRNRRKGDLLSSTRWLDRPHFAIFSVLAISNILATVTIRLLMGTYSF